MDFRLTPGVQSSSPGRAAGAAPVEQPAIELDRRPDQPVDGDEVALSESARDREDGNAVSRFFDELINTLESGLTGGIQWLEHQAGEQAKKAAESVKDVPLLGGVARAQAWKAETGAALLGAAARGATGGIAEAARAATHPVDTVKSLLSVKSAVPLLPLNPLALLHGAADLLTDRASAAKSLLSATKPADLLGEPARLGRTLEKGLREPYAAAMREGRFGGPLGRDVAILGGLVLTGDPKGLKFEAGKGLEGLAQDAVRFSRSDELARAVQNLQPGVSVLVRRSDGALDGGWKVAGHEANGRVQVVKPGLGAKAVRPEALLADNPKLAEAR